MLEYLPDEQIKGSEGYVEREKEMVAYFVGPSGA